MDTFLRDYVQFLSSMGAFVSSLGLTMLGIPQCSLADVTGCQHQ
ncbi:hypothetical protein [Corynebacterium sp.]|nr:hypothetical protein [Corynebacterium sp.]MDO5511337.1 hypothetical protein [Corynebacterium sp.]